MIYIDEVQTKVQVQAVEPRADRNDPEPPWQQLARLRQWQQRLLEDEARTSASGNEG